MNNFNPYFQSDLTKQEKYTLKKLQELKDNQIKAFAFDYDGTLRDKNHPQYNHHQAFELIISILKRNIAVGILTSRAATFEKLLDQKLLTVKNEIKTPFFFGAGNGSRLIVFKKEKKQLIYQNDLTDEEIVKIISNITRLTRIKDLQEEGLQILKKTLTEDWQGYIKPYFLSMSKKRNSAFLIERAKVSFVLPKKSTTADKLIKSLRKQLGERFSIVKGDNVFGHVGKRLLKDGKLFAIKKIIRYLGINKSHLGVFGDMPEDNDKAMLSELPFTFTNDFNFKKRNLKSPPYVLPYSNPSVKTIYQAVQFLLKN